MAAEKEARESTERAEKKAFLREKVRKDTRVHVWTKKCRASRVS